MKKVLFVATVVQKHIKVFHTPYLEMFGQAGYETFVAAANDTGGEVNLPCCGRYVEIGFRRNPFHPANIGAFFRLKRLINSEQFDLIHCHTPVGGVLGRLAAAKARRRGTKVLYTAHGFHFYKGAPLINWLIYYPIEKLCARLTDLLITINREDFELACAKLRAKRVEYVPGVGVDMSSFTPSKEGRGQMREALGVPESATVLLSVGELNANKNHETVIRAIADTDVYYIIAGAGDRQTRLQQLIDETGLSSRVKLLGYRSDIAELCRAADVYALPSLREGLNLSLMEAMACALPVVCSRIRGNVDLIDPEGGVMFDPRSARECRQAIQAVMGGDMPRMGRHNLDKVREFSAERVSGIMRDLYGL